MAAFDVTSGGVWGYTLTKSCGDSDGDRSSKRRSASNTPKNPEEALSEDYLGYKFFCSSVGVIAFLENMSRLRASVVNAMFSICQFLYLLFCRTTYRKVPLYRSLSFCYSLSLSLSSSLSVCMSQMATRGEHYS